MNYSPAEQNFGTFLTQAQINITEENQFECITKYNSFTKYKNTYCHGLSPEDSFLQWKIWLELEQEQKKNYKQ
jgi:hypothetical protein